MAFSGNSLEFSGEGFDKLLLWGCVLLAGVYVKKVTEGSVFFRRSCRSKVVTMGPITEVTTFLKDCAGPPVRRLDADRYFDIRTGEVFEYKHIENRAGSKCSITATMAKIRGLVNTNVVVADNCRWVTLTYADNMTDTKQLYSDYHSFWKRFFRYCSSHGWDKPEYISVIEPQARGAWHCHVFFIWSSSAPFIPNADLFDLWGHGFVKITAVSNVDNIGAYFSAYLADIPLDDYNKSLSDVSDSLSIVEKEIIDNTGQKVKKKFVKGGRLHMYPPNMNILRCSRGVKRPVVDETDYGDVKKEQASLGELTYSTTLQVQDLSGACLNAIHKEYYNRKRIASQC